MIILNTFDVFAIIVAFRVSTIVGGIVLTGVGVDVVVIVVTLFEILH